MGTTLPNNPTAVAFYFNWYHFHTTLKLLYWLITKLMFFITCTASMTRHVHIKNYLHETDSKELPHLKYEQNKSHICRSVNIINRYITLRYLFSTIRSLAKETQKTKKHVLYNVYLCLHKHVVHVQSSSRQYLNSSQSKITHICCGSAHTDNQ